MYKQILVPLDGSETAARGLSEAIALAQALGGQLHLLHVVSDLQWFVDPLMLGYPEGLHQELRRFGEELLAKGAKLAEAAGVVARTQLRDATGFAPGYAIVQEAIASGCQLVVMGTHGRRGVGRMLLGSDAAVVVSISPVPVLLVRQEAPAHSARE